MLLLLGQLAQAIGHALRLVELARARPAPRRARARPGTRPGSSTPSRCVCSQTARRLSAARAGSCASSAAIPRARSASSRSQPHAGRLGARERLRRPPLRLLRKAAACGEQRAAALVHRPDQELRSEDSRPLVEQPRGRLPVAGAQLELAQVQALQGVRDALAALVGERQQPRQKSPAPRSTSPRQTSRWPATRSGESAM